MTSQAIALQACQFPLEGLARGSLAVKVLCGSYRFPGLRVRS